MKYQSIETNQIENFKDNFNHIFECKNDMNKDKKERVKDIKSRSLTLDLVIENNGQMTLF